MTPPTDTNRLEELTARARRTIAARLDRQLPSEPGCGSPDASNGSAVSDASALLATPAALANGATGGDLVLGVDPGTATTGYGFVRRLAAGEDIYRAVAYGVIETPPEMEMPQRLLALFRELRHLIALHRPSAAAVEKLFFGRNTTTAITVGQARGVVLLALAEGAVTVAEYTPVEVKQALAGFGGADKLQMQRMVQMQLGLPELPRPDDAADGLAIAICHLRLARRRALGLR